MRAIWSDAPLAPAATTISTGLVGSHASAGALANTIASAAPVQRHVLLISGIASSPRDVMGRWPEDAALPLLCLSGILPLCACGARAGTPMGPPATLGRSIAAAMVRALALGA